MSSNGKTKHFGCFDKGSIPFTAVYGGKIMSGPTVIIIGAPRSGTTTLFKNMSRHPEIEGSRHKEPYFFHVNKPRPNVSDLEQLLGTSAPFGSQHWYGRVYKIGNAHSAVYEHLWTNKSLHRLEATPCYLYDKEVPARIYEKYPDIRLILSLRHPVHRALSHWKMYIRAGWEPEADPQKAFEAEPYMVDEFFWGERNYIRHSFYGKQLQRYLKYFPKGHIKVVIYESFYENQQVGLNGIFSWLGIKSENLSGLEWKQPLLIETQKDFINEWSKLFVDDVKLLEDLIGRRITEWKLS